MSSALLTADELSALAEGVKDGSIAVDTGFNTNARVRKHDLASEDSSLGVNVSSIDMINERFVRMFRLGLLEVLRSSPRVNPTRVQIVRFGDYLKGLKAPLSVNSAPWTVFLAALATASSNCRPPACSPPPRPGSSR